ncbi:hypothetical protein [Chitinivorax sp. B]|uniref:substrate-binding periplasmic protein n=1 Tax=Chitinivorax sp. B TaxID=2502235 RepID=UPI0010F57F26|nr:hypothetical protein [Chitinivorax sp. B]
MIKAAQLITAAICLLTVAVHAAEKTMPPIKLCYEGEDSFPWILKDQKGLNLIMLEQVAKASNLKLEMHPMPWKRCLYDVKHNTMHGAFAASYNADRAEFSVYPMKDGKPDSSRRMMFDSYSLYRLKGSPVSWDGNTFQGLEGPVGTQLGYSITDMLKLADIEVDDGAKTADDTLRKLVLKRIVAAALLTPEGDNSIASNSEFTHKIERVPIPLVEKPYFLIFSKPFQARYPAITNQLWDAVALIRDSTEYQQAESAMFRR